MDSATIIAQRLASIRKAKGMTQEGLSAATGIARQTISKIENGNADGVALAKIVAVAAALGYELELKPKTVTVNVESPQSGTALGESWTERHYPDYEEWF